MHKYDPVDLHLRQPSQTTITLAPRLCVTEEDVQEEEIVQAKAAGLQVAFGSMGVGNEAAMFSVNVAAEEGVANNNVGNLAQREGEAAKKMTGEFKMREMALFDEEAAYQQIMQGTLGLDECDSDSDSDLL